MNKCDEINLDETIYIYIYIYIYILIVTCKYHLR